MTASYAAFMSASTRLSGSPSEVILVRLLSICFVLYFYRIKFVVIVVVLPSHKQIDKCRDIGSTIV